MTINEAITQAGENQELVTFLKDIDGKVTSKDTQLTELITQNDSLKNDIKSAVEKREAVKTEFESFKSTSDKKDWIDPKLHAEALKQEQQKTAKANSKNINLQRETLLSVALSKINLKKADTEAKGEFQRQQLKLSLNDGLSYDESNGFHYADTSGNVMRSPSDPTKLLSVSDRLESIKSSGVFAGIIKAETSDGDGSSDGGGGSGDGTAKTTGEKLENGFSQAFK